MLAASFEGNLIFILIAGAVGVINLLLERQKKKKEQEEIEYRQRQTQTPATNKRPIATTTQQSEEERLRKFLEALGVPAPPTNTPSIPKPAPAPPPPQYRPIPPPRTIVPPVQRQQPPRPQYQPQIRRQRQEHRPPPPQPVFEKEMASMEDEGTSGNLVQTGTSIEQIRKDFDMDVLPAMDVSATTRANDKLVASAYVLPSTESVPSANTGNLLAALRSPQNLRTLILVREILGPPPSLQSN